MAFEPAPHPRGRVRNMTPKMDGRPRAVRQGTSQIAQLGGIERTETSPTGRQTQPVDEARRCELISRSIARAVPLLPSSLAFQGAALGFHYSRRAAHLWQVGGVQ